MGLKTTIQLINRKNSQQYFINFPAACAQMLELEKGEVVEWVITDDGDLLLKRFRERTKPDVPRAESNGEN